MNFDYLCILTCFILVQCQKSLTMKYGIRSNIEQNFENDMFKSNLRKRSTSENDLSSAWYLPSDYDPDLEPWNFRQLTNSSMPWNYHFIYSIFEIQEIDDQKRTILLNMYFIIYWLEPRIEINSTAMDWTDDTNGNMSFIPLGQMDRFWYPDLEIYKMKTYDAKSALKDMASFKVNKTKWLRYSSRVDITLSCHMNFDEYPLDSHDCPFRVGSYYSSIGTVNCSSNYEFTNDDQPMLHYSIELQPLPEKLRLYSVWNQDWATCGFNIHLKRTRIQNFFEVYLTCTLLVIISWISFVIRPEVVPGRMGLLVTTLLVLINIFIGIKSKAPISSGLNAFDVFLIICIGQVFVACLEYAMVLVLMDSKEQASIVPLKARPRSFIEKKNAKKDISKDKQMKLDKLSLVAFPFCYLFMLLVYFSVYI